MADDGGALDDILDDALDAIDEDDGKEESEKVDLKAAASAAASTTAETADEAAKAAEANAADAGFGSIEETMSKLMAEMENPEFAESLDEAFKMLNLGGEGDEKDAAKALESLLGGEGGDEEMAATFKALAEAAQGMEGANPDEAEKMGEEMMKEMFAQLDKMGQKGDFESHVDNIMQTLVSKDVMYTPTKLVCEAFPGWLEENKDKVSKEDFERYQKQHEYFQLMLKSYDEEPNNFAKPMELLQEMQQYGQPPVEIVQKLAPGMEIGADGLPKLDGPLPGMPGGSQGCPQM
mmetsp:Transcript_11921/g.13735  ORF Transcript_11921/g.13735 Transcript_11921/m.13735 type:complete len:292 (+) Transcript_11921:173-1048(+)|eukprot:CAMPEP_0184021894 /NCGR_PEP_ID=MMETSP0954-20121128/10221_1 /TAXON_ID=627963 /ORGANISM="Aplanochytrium sp, Strain PBS07" /LENGTH=291 /DNA_ID=CAMNT_0026304043 /DNA_START=175 /DNA_END=1050 /DNA_ORIENTATION=-